MEDDDYELHSALPKIYTNTTEMEPKKITTKNMVHQALDGLVTNRKGISLTIIKRYIKENYNLDTEAPKYSKLIKNCLKSGVEDGSIIQTTGMGASGSFKLAKKKEVKKKKVTTKKVTIEKQNKTEKAEKKPTEKKKSKPNKTKDQKIEGKKSKPIKTKDQKIEGKKKMVDIVKRIESKSLKNAVDVKRKSKVEAKPVSKKMKMTQKIDKVDKENEKTKGKKEKKPVGILFTPAKKHALLKKRKSIGSIIKPPKMKPQ